MKILFVVSLLLFAGVAQAQELNLTWADTANNELGFDLERGDSESGPFTVLGSTAVDVDTYTDTTVVPGVVYCYRVRAYNERNLNGNVVKQFSGYSNVACGSWVDTPGTPTDLLISEAQEAIGSAQEQLGVAQQKLAQALVK